MQIGIKLPSLGIFFSFYFLFQLATFADVGIVFPDGNGTLFYTDSDFVVMQPCKRLSLLKSREDCSSDDDKQPAEKMLVKDLAQNLITTIIFNAKMKCLNCHELQINLQKELDEIRQKMEPIQNFIAEFGEDDVDQLRKELTIYEEQATRLEENLSWLVVQSEIMDALQDPHKIAVYGYSKNKTRNYYGYKLLKTFLDFRKKALFPNFQTLYNGIEIQCNPVNRYLWNAVMNLPGFANSEKAFELANNLTIEQIRAFIDMLNLNPRYSHFVSVRPELLLQDQKSLMVRTLIIGRRPKQENTQYLFSPQEVDGALFSQVGLLLTIDQKEYLSVKDTEGNWLPAVVLEKDNGIALIHYLGWSAKWDERIRLDDSKRAKKYMGNHELLTDLEKFAGIAKKEIQELIKHLKP